jgi:hypothetical protein
MNDKSPTQSRKDNSEYKGPGVLNNLLCDFRVSASLRWAVKTHANMDIGLPRVTPDPTYLVRL